MGSVIAALVSPALASLVLRCAPNVGPTTMLAIVAYESAGRPNAIGDNTARRSYDPKSATEAIALATTLVRSSHNIDVGLAQVNSSNFGAYGLDVAHAFDPCTNVAIGSRILRGSYARAALAYGPGPRALAYALSAYNTGGFFTGSTYAGRVYATAARLGLVKQSRIATDFSAERNAVSDVVSRFRRRGRAVPFIAAVRGVAR